MRTTLKSILLVSASGEVRERLAIALAGYHLSEADSWQDAVERLSGQHPDLVLIEPVDVHRVLRGLDRLSPRVQRVFLVDDTTPAVVRDELVDAAVEGHVFDALDPNAPPDRLRATFERLLIQRQSGRLAPAVGLEAVFSIDGTQLRLPCVDVSNQGLLMRAPLDASLGWLPAGTRLSGMRLERAGWELLRTDTAFVRHVGVARGDGQPFFRMGVKLEPPGGGGASAELSVLRGWVRITALFRRALHREGRIRVRLLDSDGPEPQTRAVLSGGGTGGRPVLRCEPIPDWDGEVGDVVRVGFDFGGTSYQGSAAILAQDRDALVLSLPRTLTLSRQRGSPRFRVQPERPFGISFVSPLTLQRVERPVLDLHTSGLAFTFDAAREALPAGLRLEDLHLVLPNGRSVRCRAEVRDVNPARPGPSTEGLSQPFRCGVRLTEVPEEARRAILDAFLATRSSHVRDGRTVPFREIWRTLRQTRLFHPDFPKEEGPHLDLLEETHRRLAAGGEGLARSFLYHDGARVLGHASGVRTHSRTWMMQHLALLPARDGGELASRELTSLVMDYGEVLGDVDFLRLHWRVESRWSDRAYGWIARSMLQDGLTRLRFINYLRLPLSASFSPRDELPAARPAGPDDLAWLETHLQRQGEVVRLWSDDLHAREAELPTVGARYAAAGLRRARTLFVVDGPGQPLAFALADEASPGLSLPGMASAFSFIVPDPAAPGVDTAREALLVRCIEHYRALGQPSAVGLVADHEVGLLQAYGFAWHGRMAEWTFHRSISRTWHSLMGAVLERVRRAAEAARTAVPLARGAA